MLTWNRASAIWRATIGNGFFGRQRTLARRKNQSAALHQLEHLEPRLVLTPVVNVVETYRDFNFYVNGGGEGHTRLPTGFFGNPYADDYNFTVVRDESMGTVSFTSPTEGSGSANSTVTGSGEDNFGPYDFTYGSGGTGTVNNGVLTDFFAFTPYYSEEFTVNGTFNAQSWAVSSNWTGPVYDEVTGDQLGTTYGTYTGFVDQDHLPKTDFNVTLVIDTTEADAARTSSNSVNTVAEKVKAFISIDVSGQHMRAPSMGTPATHASLYFGGTSSFFSLGDPIPIHWNAGNVTIEVTEFLPAFDTGDGKFYVILDEEGRVEEADESNNQFEFDVPFDLQATGLGWAPDGSIIAGYDVMSPGFSNGGVLGSTTMVIYFADAGGTPVDADTDPEFLNYLAFRSISGLTSPESTTGTFLQFTETLTMRPEGATQIVAAIDRNNIPPNTEIDEFNNVLFLQLSEIQVTAVNWNSDGSATFTVNVSNAALAFDTTVGVYWGSGSISDPSLDAVTNFGLSAGLLGDVTFTVSSGVLGTAPTGAQALVFLPDPATGSRPMGQILEPIENDAAFLPVNPIDLSFTVFAETDNLRDANATQQLEWSFVADTNAGPQNGAVFMLPDGQFYYTPNTGFLGEDQFDYYLESPHGRSLSATITLNVIPLNESPIAVDQFHEITVNATFQGTVSATDNEGDTLTYRLDTPPVFGTVTINPDGTFTYEPPLNFEGFDEFSFIANDGFSDSFSGFVQFQIVSNNQFPLIEDQAFSVASDVAAGAVVGTAVASDPDDDTLTYAIEDGNTDNAFAINSATGQITVVDPAALTTSNSPFFLLVKITDDGAPPSSAFATITIEVNETVSAPTLTLGGGPVTFVKKDLPISVMPNVVVDAPLGAVGGGQLIITMNLVRKKAKLFDTIPGLQFASLLGNVTGPVELPDGRSRLTIDLESYIGPAEVQQFLRAFRFTTKGRGLKVPTRTVQVQLIDQFGNASEVMQQTINVRKK